MQLSQKIRWYKKLTILLAITTIVPTALILMSVAAPSPANDQSEAVSQVEARSYILNYRNKQNADSQLNGIRIEAGQLESMNNIAQTKPNTSAYRLYFAEDTVGTPLSIVVGINDEGADMPETIFMTGRKGSNLCPPVCDANSPLTN